MPRSQRYRTYKKAFGGSGSNGLGNKFCKPSEDDICNTNRQIDNHLMLEWIIPAKKTKDPKSPDYPGWPEKITSHNIYFRWPLAGWYMYTTHPWGKIMRENEQFFKKRLTKFHHSIKVKYFHFDKGEEVDQALFYDGTSKIPLIKKDAFTDFDKFQVRDMAGVTVTVHMYLLSYKGWRRPSVGWRVWEVFTKPDNPMDSGICSTFKVMAQKKYQHCIGSYETCDDSHTYSLTWSGSKEVCLYKAKYDSEENVFVEDNFLEVIMYFDSATHAVRSHILSEPLQIPTDKATGVFINRHPGLVYHNYKYVEWQDMVRPGYTLPKTNVDTITGTEACYLDCSAVIQGPQDPNMPNVTSFGCGSSPQMNMADANFNPPEDHLPEEYEGPTSDNDEVNENNKRPTSDNELSLEVQQPKKKSTRKSVFFG